MWRRGCHRWGVVCLMFATMSVQTASADTVEDIEAEARREGEATALVPLRRKVIKVLQPKSFMKISRAEIEPFIATLANNPFLNQFFVGAHVAYHPTEILGIELEGAFAPDLGDAEYTRLTTEMHDRNGVVPDVSRILWYGTINLVFSPIYGKIALANRTIIHFDVYGTFGTGLVMTRDDLALMGLEDNVHAQSTAEQFHPAMTFGGGVRVTFNRFIALRLETRGLSYFEVVGGDSLEFKPNVMLAAGVSVFVPQTKRRQGQ